MGRLHNVCLQIAILHYCKTQGFQLTGFVKTRKITIMDGKSKVWLETFFREESTRDINKQEAKDSQPDVEGKRNEMRRRS